MNSIQLALFITFITFVIFALNNDNTDDDQGPDDGMMQPIF